MSAIGTETKVGLIDTERREVDRRSTRTRRSDAECTRGPGVSGPQLGFRGVLSHGPIHNSCQYLSTEGSYEMGLDLIIRAAALIAVLGNAVVYGTDVFCAIVLRPALVLVDDRALVAVTGNVHRYGDRRMPVPGVLGVLATATSAVLATVGAHWTQANAAGAALVLLLVLDCALHAGERTHQTTTDGGRRRQPAATEWACAASKVGPNDRRPRDAARSGTGRPMRGADDLTRPRPRIHITDIN